MKNSILFVFATFILLSGCKKECELGYEGKGCKTEVRAKYYGSYKGVIVQNNTPGNLTITVGTTSSNATQAIAGGLLITFENNDGDFYVATQNVIFAGNTWSAYGTGAFDSNEITMNYYLERNGQTIQVFYTGIKD
jgi:hypothetical protein